MEAPRDGNFVPVIMGTLNTNGETPVAIKADPSSHGVATDDDTTGSDNGGTIAPRDENHVTAWIAVSADDGETPVAVYADADGNLLIDSN